MRQPHRPEPEPLTATPSGALAGDVRIPGDKSISHRALIFATLASGRSRIEGLLEGEDVLATAEAMRALGAAVTRDAGGVWHVDGAGIGALLEPDAPLDFGNAGTGVRLCLGLVAGHGITATFDAASPTPWALRRGSTRRGTPPWSSPFRRATIPNGWPPISARASTSHPKGKGAGSCCTAGPS